MWSEWMSSDEIEMLIEAVHAVVSDKFADLGAKFSVADIRSHLSARYLTEKLKLDDQKIDTIIAMTIGGISATLSAQRADLQILQSERPGGKIRWERALSAR
jgi:hypothetical protein